MLGVALLASLALGGTPAAETCPPPPAPASRIERFMAARAAFGFRSDRAYVKRLIRRDQWEYDVGYIPATPAENRYLRLRDRLATGRRLNRYLRRHPDLSGGISVEDAWPREPYLLLRVTRDPARVRPRLRRLARFPDNLRVRRVDHSLRELTHLQNRIGDDFEALDAEGLAVASVSVDIERNTVDVELITARADAGAVFRERYGPDVRVEIVATERFSAVCADLFGYRPGPEDGTLLVYYESGGGLTFDHAVVTESADRVTVAIVVQEYNGATTADSITGEQLVTLDAPLGSRVVVDQATGRRLPVYEGP